MIAASVFFFYTDAQVVKQRAPHLYTSANAKQGYMIEDMVKINYADLFKLNADLTGGIKAHIEEGGTVKLKVYSFDKTASNGYGNPLYGYILTTSSINQYAGETWGEGVALSGWEADVSSNNIKALCQSAQLYFSPDCAQFAPDPVNGLDLCMHKFDGIDGTLVPPSCDPAFEPVQPVIIHLEIFDAIVTAIKIPGIGEFEMPVLPDQVFAIVGDYGCDRIGNSILPASPPNENWELQVAALVKSWDPEYIISLGDDNYADQGLQGKQNCSVNMDDNIGKYFHEYIYNYTGSHGAGSPTRRFFPVPGNHDYFSGIQNWVNYFDNPTGSGNERYYDFVKGNIHFVAMDLNPYNPQADPTTNAFSFNFIPDLNVNAARAQWAQSVLSNSTAKFKIAYGHYSPYVSMIDRQSEGGWSDPDIPLKIELRWPFKDWGASVLLAGDDHFYERNVVDGFNYVVNGFGGFPKIPDIRPNEIAQGNVIHYNQRHGAIRAEVYEDVIKFSFINIDGVAIDEFYIRGDDGASPPAARTADPATTDNTSVPATDNKMIVFPNPAENSAVIRINSKAAASQCQLTIINTQGIEVLSKQINLRQGDTVVPLNNIPQLGMGKGIYIVRLSGNNLQLSEKLVVQ